MLGLLKKDLTYIKKQKKFFILIIGIGLFTGIMQNNISFSLPYIMMVNSILALSTISYDEMNQGMQFIMTLPINRNEYVLSKYLFSWVLIAIGFFTGMLAVVIGACVNQTAIVWPEVLMCAGACTTGILAFYAVNFPIQLKFGHEKGRIVLFVFGGLVFAGVYILDVVAKNIDMEQFLIKLASMQLSPEILLAVAFGIVLVIYLISILLSVQIMKKKEY